MPTRTGQYQRRVALLTPDGSTVTSSWQYVGDYDEMTLSWASSTGSTQSIRVYGSNDDGFRSSIATSSTLTTITAQGIYDITTGFRWMRVDRDNSANTGLLSTIAAQGRAIT